jgi:hypothetical protein
MFEEWVCLLVEKKRKRKGWNGPCVFSSCKGVKGARVAPAWLWIATYFTGISDSIWYYSALTNIVKSFFCGLGNSTAYDVAVVLRCTRIAHLEQRFASITTVFTGPFSGLLPAVLYPWATNIKWISSARPLEDDSEPCFPFNELIYACFTFGWCYWKHAKLRCT